MLRFTITHRETQKTPRSSHVGADIASFPTRFFRSECSPRVGVLETNGRLLQTPEIAIVATEGKVRCLPDSVIAHTPLQYGIANTFHILVKDILPEIEKNGGIHPHMSNSGVMATDSGGFQVFSLGFGKTHGTNKLGAIFPGRHDTTGGSEAPDSVDNPDALDSDNPVRITEEGAMFVFDNKQFVLSPESSMEIQHRIGADIIFAFDECTSSLNSKQYTEAALERTHRWLDRCIAAHSSHASVQALFGIVQGGAWEDLRYRSTEYLARCDVPGYGIGGSLGKTKEDMHRILEWTIPRLPDEKPRHLLGIGSVPDIFEGVQRGVDLFDCVIPTREARHRMLYTVRGRIAVRKLRESDDIIDTRPGSPTLEGGVTGRMLAEWMRDRDSRGVEYATRHNIFFFSMLMKEIREAIQSGELAKLKEQYLRVY